MKSKMKLEDLGFTDWFRERAVESDLNDYGFARVTAVNKDNYVIRNEELELQAAVTGKILYAADSNLSYPTVGDWTRVQYFDENSFAVIHEVLPRKSLLKRKTAGKKIDYQLVAANIDIAFIVQSLGFNFNLRRLERYLIMANESTIQPVILLSKMDLVDKKDVEKSISAVQSLNQNYDVVAFSNETGDGLSEIEKLVEQGKTYCLLGSSGVGKTSLLNKLIGEDIFATAAVREKDGKGRHQTSRRQLTILKSGGLIIDTPGMRELGNIEIETGLTETFNDIVMLAQKCRFNNCAHTNEPGCSVLEAVENEEISEKRYQNYLRLCRELEYNKMSYLDKRKKDKQFGKMVKEVMKHKKSK